MMVHRNDLYFLYDHCQSEMCFEELLNANDSRTALLNIINVHFIYNSVLPEQLPIHVTCCTDMHASPCFFEVDSFHHYRL